MHYTNIHEEELKNRVGEDYFADFDYKKIIGKVDFCVQPKKTPNQAELFKEQSLLWAEAKANKHDTIAMFAQLSSARSMPRRSPSWHTAKSSICSTNPTSTGM